MLIKKNVRDYENYNIIKRFKKKTNIFFDDSVSTENFKSLLKNLFKLQHILGTKTKY